RGQQVSGDPKAREPATDAAEAADATEQSPPQAGGGDARAGDAARNGAVEAERADTAGAGDDAAAGGAGDDRAAPAAGGEQTGGGGAEGGEPSEDDADLRAAAEALEVDLELLLSERAQYLDAYRRAQADFENYRKQAQRRQEEAVVRALGRFVENLLPVLDSCDAALAHGAKEVEPVLTALYGALSKEGLERIEPKGAAFDPTEAEAVVHEPGEGGEQVVAEVL